MIVSRSAEIIPRDGVLFRQGDPADCLYFVRSGEANLTMQAGGKEVGFELARVRYLASQRLLGISPIR